MRASNATGQEAMASFSGEGVSRAGVAPSNDGAGVASDPAGTARVDVGVSLEDLGLDSVDLGAGRKRGRRASGASGVDGSGAAVASPPRREGAAKRRARELDEAFVAMRRKPQPISSAMTQSPRLKGVLRGMLLFRKVSTEDFDRFYSLLRWRSVAAGSQLLAGGERSPWVFLLAQGTAKIHQQCLDGTQVIYAICGPGEILGELSAIDGDTHSATVTMLDSSVLGAVSREEFTDFLLATPQMALNLSAITSRRLRAATARIHALSRLDVTGRLAAQLLLFASHYGQPTTVAAGSANERSALTIDLHLRQSDLADLIGASRVRVNQALHQLRRLGHIEVAGNRITLLDADALRARCG